MNRSLFSLSRWHVRFVLRLVFYGVALILALAFTAQSFDSTEVTAWLLFVSCAIVFEGALAAIGGQWPPRRPPSQSGSARRAS